MIHNKHHLFSGPVQSLETMEKGKPSPTQIPSEWQKAIILIVTSHVHSAVPVMFDCNTVTKSHKWKLEGYESFIDTVIDEFLKIHIQPIRLQWRSTYTAPLPTTFTLSPGPSGPGVSKSFRCGKVKATIIENVSCICVNFVELREYCSMITGSLVFITIEMFASLGVLGVSQSTSLVLARRKSEREIKKMIF
jgi:hypothetical protein